MNIKYSIATSDDEIPLGQVYYHVSSESSLYLPQVRLDDKGKLKFNVLDCAVAKENNKLVGFVASMTDFATVQPYALRAGLDWEETVVQEEGILSNYREKKIVTALHDTATKYAKEVKGSKHLTLLVNWQNKKGLKFAEKMKMTRVLEPQISKEQEEQLGIRSSRNGLFQDEFLSKNELWVQYVKEL